MWFRRSTKLTPNFSGKLCAYAWQIGDVVPLIYDHQDKIYTDGGLYFDALRHLEEIGLISFQPIAGYAKQHLP